MEQTPNAMDLPIDSVKPHPANPRKGNVAKIAESIKTNGFYGSEVHDDDFGWQPSLASGQTMWNEDNPSNGRGC